MLSGELDLSYTLGRGLNIPFMGDVFLGSCLTGSWMGTRPPLDALMVIVVSELSDGVFCGLEIVVDCVIDGLQASWCDSRIGDAAIEFVACAG